MILFNGFQAKEIDFQPLINTYNLLSAVLIHIEPFIVPSIGGAPVVVFTNGMKPCRVNRPTSTPANSTLADLFPSVPLPLSYLMITSSELLPNAKTAPADVVLRAEYCPELSLILTL